MKRILKSKIFLIIVVIGVVIVLLALFFGRTKPAKIGEIEYFHFRYSNGSMANGSVSYAMELKGDGYTASIQPLYEPEEAKRFFAVDESFARELEQLLVQYKVGKWNGFNKFNKMVMDGDNFSLSVMMTDGTTLDASGYMKWPKNYPEVRDGIEELFARAMAEGAPLENPDAEKASEPPNA